MKNNNGRPIVIGLCGRSGAGKGLVSSLFAELGIPSVDTDAVYRALTSAVPDRASLSECMKELADAFSERILKEDLSLDRRVLAEIVFTPGADDKLRLLNSITHRHILKHTDELIEQYGKEGAVAVVVDAPVLFESGYDKKCDVTIAVTAPCETLKQRIMLRDGITSEMAERRLASQKSDAELSALTDMVIVNDSSDGELREKVRAAAEFALGKDDLK